MLQSKCLPLDDPANLWKYCPSLAAALVFFILFGGSTLFHIFQAIKFRKTFCWVLIMGGIWETLAYITRFISAQNPTKSGTYDLNFILILLAPLWINAFDYMLLGRMVWFFLPEKKLFGIKASMMGVMFVCLDVFSFLVQLAGAALAVSKDPSKNKTGTHVYTVGVVIQQLFICCFMLMTVKFGHALNRKVSEHANIYDGKKLLHVLHASLALISFRVIFRIVEFSGGKGSSLNNTINSHEYFIYIFDSVPMFLAMALMNFWHPGHILKGPESEWKNANKKQKRHRRRRSHRDQNGGNVEMV